MFTSKAERKTNFVLKNTPKNVAPGSYEISKEEKKNFYKGNAPFLNSTKRVHHSEYIQKEIGPPPGYYYNEKKERKEKITNSPFKSLTKRFYSPNKETPGVGEYELSLPVTKKSYKVKTNRPSSDENNILKKTSPLQVLFKTYTPPSIPSHFDSYGYEEGRNGELIKQKPNKKIISGKKEDSVGPGEYNIKSCFQEDFSQGENAIFKSKSKREGIYSTIKNLQKIPGPGSYFESKKNEEEELFKVKIPFNSKTERSQWFIDQTAKNPPPGYYGIKSDFTTKSPKNNQKIDIINEKETTKKSPTKTSTVPPVGYYETQKFFGMKDFSYPERFHGPFGTTSSRFSRKKESVLGPGAYSLNSGDFKKKKFGGYGVFGTTSRRFFEKKDTNPGPGSYQYFLPDEINLFKQMEKPSSVFINPTKNGESPYNLFLEKKKEESLPGPGSYDIKSDWIKKPQHFEQSELHNDNRLKSENFFSEKKKKSFQSTSARFKYKEPEDNVGPGSYNILEMWRDKSKNKKKVPFGSSTTRFQKKRKKLTSKMFAFKLWDKSLTKRPTTTIGVTAGALAFAGDVIAQYVNQPNEKDGEKIKMSEKLKKVNYKNASIAGVVGGVGKVTVSKAWGMLMKKTFHAKVNNAPNYTEKVKYAMLDGLVHGAIFFPINSISNVGGATLLKGGKLKPAINNIFKQDYENKAVHFGFATFFIFLNVPPRYQGLSTSVYGTTYKVLSALHQKSLRTRK